MVTQRRHPTLQELRECAGLTIRQAADAVGLPATTYYRYEGQSAKGLLPRQKVAKLTPLIHQLESDPAHIHGLAALPTEDGRAPERDETVVPLSRLRLSARETVLVKEWARLWRDDQCYESRKLLIETLRPGLRSIVERFAMRTQLPLSELLQEAHMGLIAEIDRYTAGGEPIECCVEQAVIKKLRLYQDEVLPRVRIRWGARPMFDASPRRRIREWIRRHKHNSVDSPIPLCGVKSAGGACLTLTLGSESATCKRPPALAFMAYVYGLRLIDDTTSRRHSAGQLILINAQRSSNVRGEALLSRFADESKTEIHAELVWQMTVKDDVMFARSLYDDAPLSYPRGEVATHALLEIEDLL